MSDIKVSIIVPIYNAEPYLNDCLDSMVNQTLREIEIILIDDGSTDRCAEICKEYLSDPRVSYYYKENEGLAAARADGILHATGEYIGFMDADDWGDLRMYEIMYNAAKECGADVAWCNKVYGTDGHKASPELEAGIYDRKGIVEKVLPRTMAYINENGDKRTISWSNGRRIYRRAFVEENNIQFDRRFRRSQDLHYTYNCMLKANCFCCLSDQYLYHVRVVGTSLARGYTKNMWHLYIPLIETLYKDTENFKEADLMDEMHLRAFFFVVECINNEFKPTCPNDRETRIRLVEEIMNDPICDRYYGHIEVEKLNPLLKMYYKLICEKKAEKLLDFVPKYQKKAAKKAKRKAAVMDFLTESRFIGTMYKKIKGQRWF